MSNLRLFFIELDKLSPNRNVSNKYKKDILIVLRGILQEAYYDEAIQKNNADLIRPFVPKKPTINPFAPHEVKKILQNAQGWFRVFLAVSFYTGIRTGEAMALHVKDINLKKNIITINKTRGKFGETTPKTSSSIREVPIYSSLKPFLIEYLKTIKTKHLFTNKYQNPFNCSKNITKRHFHPLLEKLGLEKRRLYETRHTFATNMLDSGKFTVNEISRYLGHVNTQMIFTRYTKFIESEKRNIRTNIDIYSKN
jgi:integrase